VLGASLNSRGRAGHALISLVMCCLLLGDPKAMQEE
jgi:hypothetical protein